MAYYLFPGTMYKRLITIDPSDSPDLEDAHKIYNQCTRQYLGLGSILQFIPGTYANLARRQLTTILVDKIENCLTTIRSQNSNWLNRQHTIANLSTFLKISPLFTLLGDVQRVFNINAIKVNYNKTFWTILIKFPFIKAFFKNDYGSYIEFLSFSDIGKNIFALLINPVRLIDDALEFFHLAVNRAIEMGSERNSPSNLPRLILKGVFLFGFGLLKTPVKVLMHGIDLGRVFKVFQTIKNLIKRLHTENGVNGCQDLLLMIRCGTN